MNRRAALPLWLAALLCAGCAAAAAGGSEEPVSPPLYLAPQRVLVLHPIQAEGAAPGSADVTAPLLAALAARAPEVTWVPQAELLRGLARSPGYAPPPRQIALGALWEGRPRVVEDPLASQLRRYGALTDARLLLLVAAAGTPEAEAVRLRAVLLDSRSGRVVWRGHHDEPPGSANGSAAAAAAESLVRRLLRDPTAAVAPESGTAALRATPQWTSGPSVATVRRGRASATVPLCLARTFTRNPRWSWLIALR